MEKTTGQVLYAKNEHEQLEPASVTKVMTLLLAMEALDEGRIRYDDTVTVSAYAASMGGSRVFLSEGEQITVEDLFKAICVASRKRRVRRDGRAHRGRDGAVRRADERPAPSSWG